MPGIPRSLSSATPQVLAPAPGDTILCHAAAVRVKVSPDDAVLCFTVTDNNGVPLSPTVQRGASNGIYAGNIDFGPLPQGSSKLRVCYAKDGVSCTSGSGGCSIVAVVVECKSTTTMAPPAGGTA